MASARIVREYWDVELPPVCMKCGASADPPFRKTFNYFPPWIFVFLLLGALGILLILILMAVASKRAALWVPMCPRHRSHWLIRAIAVAILVALNVATFIVAMLWSDLFAFDSDIGGSLFCASGVLFLVFLVTLIVLSATQIRLEMLTDYDLVLAGVHQRFAQAIFEGGYSVPPRVYYPPPPPVYPPTVPYTPPPPLAHPGDDHFAPG